MLKAIETRYKGYRFRSRLEARWAVFFDALKIKWEYEIEGFDLGVAGLYLPDFWLKEHGVWIEIKGKYPNTEEIKKAARLTSLSEYKTPALIVSGMPEEETIHVPEIPGLEKLGMIGKKTYSYLVWCNFSCYITHNPEHVASELNTCPRIRNAYEAARSARFEHGESPNA